MGNQLPAGIERRLRIVSTMGTVIGIDLRDAQVASSALDEAEAWLVAVDRRFSPYRPTSEISRLARGEIELEACAPEVRYVLTRCEALRVASHGSFDIRAAGLRGGLDPSGYVKGWGTEEAAFILEAAGARNYLINAGGDVLARGAPEPGRGWVVGIRHPLESDQVVARVSPPPDATRFAVATSGGYERGDHIIDPTTGRAASGWLSLSVAGPSLAQADAYATAAFAMGRSGLAWLAELPGYEGYAIDGALRPSWTAGFDLLLV
ncbi:MAG TPA: FAD:protein FMN transferase [Candidatus Limnocylindrales bacterium]